MVRRYGNVLMIVAVLAAMGAHWTALQSLAWTRMLAENLASCSVTEAVQKTFDGEHPCCLCKAIAAGKKSEPKKDYTVPMQRLEFLPAMRSLVFTAPSDFQLLPQIDCFTDSLTSEPPTPPPRNPIV